uniref:Uncharacterized protein n=1 Tax=Anguilla anguilla TaxID=7936 RepID=A0A0E9WC90_ANGAN
MCLYYRGFTSQNSFCGQHYI